MNCFYVMLSFPGWIEVLRIHSVKHVSSFNFSSIVKEPVLHVVRYVSCLEK